jgi:hypothetical protein
MLITQKHLSAVAANWFTILVVLILCGLFGIPVIVWLLTKLYEYFIQQVILM